MEHKTYNIKHGAWSIRRRARSARPSRISFATRYTLHATRSGGFALLFAILASSILLSVGLAIWNIAFREVILSSFGRESQSAFYIADSAIECALYWDFIGSDTFATSSDTVKYPPAFRKSSITCTGGVPNQIPAVSSHDALNAKSTFTVNLWSGKAIVIVEKSDSDGDGRSATKITSHGQNSLISSDPTLVERGLRTNY